MRSAVLIGLASLALAGCMGVRYLPQAAAGQLGLMTHGKRIGRAIADPATPDTTAVLLAEVPGIAAFAVRNGLDPGRSYRRYVALDREYAVWFVAGSQRLSFEPKLYWFPIVGSFAGVGWFSEARAARHVARLERQGWDAYSRGAAAYSTAGWFRDPVVSSMLVEGPASVGVLANTVLHEWLHATVLIPGQTYFNESLAVFVADEMTFEYLEERFGPSSSEVAGYRLAYDTQRARSERVLSAYHTLETLYATEAPEAEKLQTKSEILASLGRELELEKPVNNAALLGVKLYGTGRAEFTELLAVCGHDWPRFVAVLKSLHPRDFPAAQVEDLAPVLETIVAWGCEPFR
ncbi:MAG: aminopeptidase [Polyangiaceae bacterium]|nr:aminopeptidase [Polyangiaceae bacterium]